MTIKNLCLTLYSSSLFVCEILHGIYLQYHMHDTRTHRMSMVSCWNTLEHALIHAVYLQIHWQSCSDGGQCDGSIERGRVLHCAIVVWHRQLHDASHGRLRLLLLHVCAVEWWSRHSAREANRMGVGV